MHRFSRPAAVACGLALAVPLLPAPAVAADPPWTTVASGLDNPRQLSFTGDTLYVAESGVGGAGPCVDGAEGPACLGMTGAITRVRNGQQARVLTGLPSLAGEGGGGATGPADVVVTGQNKYVVTMGLGNDPAVRGIVCKQARFAVSAKLALRRPGSSSRMRSKTTTESFTE